jgi:mannosyltransferase
VSGMEIGAEDQAASVAPATPRDRASRPPDPWLAANTARRGPAWRENVLVIGIPAVTSSIVGGYELGGPSLWRDEAYTKDAIGRSAGQIFALLGHQDAVHGAYYLLMHVIAGAIGTSATALRFPSLCAMVVATAFTAAIGRRAAALPQPSGGPGPAGGHPVSPVSTPALTGLLAGMVFATAPYMTFYAQTARSYAIVTMLAAIATYLLLRAYPDGRWRWWWAYGAAIAFTGLFNLFALLILAAHGVTLLLTDAHGQPGKVQPGSAQRGAAQPGSGQPGAGRLIGRLPLRWLAVSAAALVVLGPLLRVASGQQEQIDWLTRPDFATIERLIEDFAGSKELVVPFALLALAGLAAGYYADHWRPLNPAAIALPWLVVPPFLLIAVSYAKPVYYERYVEFCLPALAILVAAGLAGIVRLGSSATLSPLRQRGLAWMPAVLATVIVLGLAALLVGPQRAIRQTASRPDNLRLASAIVAAHEQPGDVVFYIPLDMQVLGTGYPAPFLRLRNIALAESATASATLTGTEVTSPAVLKSRFTDVRRVWVVTGGSNYEFPVPYTPVDKEKIALLAGMHIIGRWQAGEVMLTLFGY